MLAVGIVALLRVAFAGVGIVSLQAGARERLTGNWMELQMPGTDFATRLLSMWQRWDALWYQHIVEQGYSSGDGSTAFFPLYPLLVRGATFIFGGQDVFASLIVSTAASIVAAWLLFRLVQFEVTAHGHGIGTIGELSLRARTLLPYLVVLLVFLFPTAFFLFAPYTESLFLLLTVGAFLLSRTGHHIWAGAVGALASLTRAQGAFLVLPLAYEYARQHDLVPWEAPRRRARLDLGATGVVMPVVGTLAFSQFIASIGEKRSALDVLTLWGYKIVAPWQAIGASFEYIQRPVGGGSPDVEFLNLAALIGFGLLAIVAWWRLARMYSVYALASVGLLTARQMYFSPLMSVARYALVIFPCFIVLALLLADRRALAALTLVGSAILLTTLFGYWVQWGFVG